MKKQTQQYFNLFCIIIQNFIIFSAIGYGQSIIPSTDGTGTQVTPNLIPGTSIHQINIQGGQLSRDGANLFHSFEQFNLQSHQIANFISNPNIQNILSRINGANPSIIDGLIQVTGGNSNLFLMNPAGIVFGANARLDVPASFLVTTADGIGFENNQWFNAVGEANWGNLVGMPQTFIFNHSTPGSIVNFGHLSVQNQQQITLLGGTIVNTGSLNGGNILVQTLPGQNLVRFSQNGHLLSLEVSPVQSLEQSGITPLSLPQLLTGSGLSEATAIQVNELGNIILTNGQQIQSGDIAIFPNLGTSSPRLTAESVTLNAADHLTLFESQLFTTGDLNLLARNTVTIRDGQTPFQAFSGGNLTIQGNQNIDILALNYPQTPFQALEDLNLISNGIISGDSHFVAGGNLRILNLSGNGGTFVSLYDPIISSENNVIFGDYRGASLKIEARGSIQGGDITITQPDASLTNLSDPDVEILRNSPSLILRSGLSVLSNPPNLTTVTTVNNTFFAPTNPSSNSDIAVGQISTAGGPVILESPGNITLDAIDSSGGNIFLNATGNLTVTGTLVSNGGEITLLTDNFLRVQGTLTNIDGINASISSADGGEGGNILIEHGGGENTPFIIGDATINGTAGAMTTGSETIFPVFSVAVPPSSYTQGNITISTTAISVTPAPTPEPTPQPTPEPTPQPTPEPTPQPTPEPTPQPTPEPTPQPTAEPTPQPTPSPLTPPPTPPLTPPPTSFPLSPTPTLSPLLVQTTEQTILQPINNQFIQPFQRLESRINNEIRDDEDILSIDPTYNILLQNELGDIGGELAVQLDENNQISLERTEIGLSEEGTGATSSSNSIEQTRLEINESLDAENFEQAITKIEEKVDSEYTDYLGRPISSPKPSLKEIKNILNTLEKKTGKTAAIVYVYSRPEQLEILVITAQNEKPFHRTITAANQQALFPVIQENLSEINSFRNRTINRYLRSSQQLHEWIIEPIEADLKSQNIDILMFSLDTGLRSIPLPALHDGQQFLIEKYGLSLIPSFSLVDNRYRRLAKAEVLTMGASVFEEQSPLFSVPLEVEIIAQERSQGEYFLNEEFTLERLQQQYQTQPSPIVHLATHADFRPGKPSNSFIQLWDTKLTLDQMQEIGWDNPTADLLVLSACRTALGDKNAELGFAGLAIASGAKSGLASLWYISDEGTLALMTEFYHHLEETTTKAEALQKTQIAMLRGQVKFDEGRLFLSEENREIPLPPELQNLSDINLTHPYYWASFTLIGSPW